MSETQFEGLLFLMKSLSEGGILANVFLNDEPVGTIRLTLDQWTALVALGDEECPIWVLSEKGFFDSIGEVAPTA